MEENVIVYETEPGRSAVAAMAPIPALGIVGDRPELRPIASEADERLRRALMTLERESMATPAHPWKD